MTLLALLTGVGGGGEQPPARVAPEPLSAEGAGTNFGTPPAGAALPVHDRPLAWYFDNEDVVISWTDGADLASWVLRDYEGAIVDQGVDPVSPLNLGRPGPGWYKLYFTRRTDVGLPWNTDGGETHFAVARSISPLQTTPLAPSDEVMTQSGGGVMAATRRLAGHGMVRLDVNVNEADPAAWRSALDAAKTAAMQAFGQLSSVTEAGVPAREVYCHFVNGTGGAAPSSVITQQITDTVQELCALGVTHFEGRNEPNTKGISGAATAAEYAAFAPTVHAAHPDAKVVGPVPVTINPTSNGLGWFEAFLAAGGGAHLDVVSFHPYNASNGDVNLGRRVYRQFLALLTTYGVQDKPRWQTEWGTFALVNGSFEPRWQTQCTMLDLHLLWQELGVHRNQTVYFYDINNGYWSYPSSLWSSNRGRLVPYALPLAWRAWVEETWEMSLVEALDFGPVENRHWIGSRFRHPSTLAECITVQGSGRVGSVSFNVSGATSLTVVNHFGASSSVAVAAGRATVPVGPEPVHIRVPVGVTVSVAPASYGTNVTPATATYLPSTGGNGPERAMDGLLQNWYELQNDVREWLATDGDYLPAWWTAEFSTAVTFDIVEIICPPPWGWGGSLLDFDIQVRSGGEWRTVYTEATTPPGLPWVSDKATSGCWADSFWDRRRIFVARLDTPATATGVRIWAREVSWGGSATIDQIRTMRALDSTGRGKRIGQGGPKRMTIQDVALYKS